MLIAIQLYLPMCLLLALCCYLCFRARKQALWLSLSLSISTLMLYQYWGNPKLALLYSHPAQENLLRQQARLRPLLVQFKKTEQKYLMRLQADPKDKAAWLGLGQIYLIKQDKEKASWAFQSAGLIE